MSSPVRDSRRDRRIARAAAGSGCAAAAYLPAGPSCCTVAIGTDAFYVYSMHMNCNVAMCANAANLARLHVIHVLSVCRFVMEEERKSLPMENQLFSTAVCVWPGRRGVWRLPPNHLPALL